MSEARKRCERSESILRAEQAKILDNHIGPPHFGGSNMVRPPKKTNIEGVHPKNFSDPPMLNTDLLLCPITI